MLSSRDSYKRRVAKLEKLLAAAHKHDIDQSMEHARKRVHYQEIVAKHIATNRRNEAKILEDAFRISELDNQVAVQWKNLAEAKDDARVSKLNCDVYRNETKRLREERAQWRCMEAALRSQVDEINERLYEATKTIQYRVWVAITTKAAAFKVAIATRVRRRPWRRLMRLLLLGPT